MTKSDNNPIEEFKPSSPHEFKKAEFSSKVYPMPNLACRISAW
jgi:hypothetical protein